MYRIRRRCIYITYPWADFVMVDISTDGIVSVPKRSALGKSRRERSEDVWFGVGTLLVVEQSSLEKPPEGCVKYTVAYGTARVQQDDTRTVDIHHTPQYRTTVRTSTCCVFQVGMLTIKSRKGSFPASFRQARDNIRRESGSYGVAKDGRQGTGVQKTDKRRRRWLSFVRLEAATQQELKDNKDSPPPLDFVCNQSGTVQPNLIQFDSFNLSPKKQNTIQTHSKVPRRLFQQHLCI